MSSTPSPCLPPSPIQSEKAKRYDRQLRLWGDHGQSALERASICLVNATATGTEILKSLVLPGLGSFTILDPALVSSEARLRFERVLSVHKLFLNMWGELNPSRQYLKLLSA